MIFFKVSRMLLFSAMTTFALAQTSFSDYRHIIGGSSDYEVLEAFFHMTELYVCAVAGSLNVIRLPLQSGSGGYQIGMYGFMYIVDTLDSKVLMEAALYGYEFKGVFIEKEDTTNTFYYGTAVAYKDTEELVIGFKFNHSATQRTWKSVIHYIDPADIVVANGVFYDSQYQYLVIAKSGIRLGDFDSGAAPKFLTSTDGTYIHAHFGTNVISLLSFFNNASTHKIFAHLIPYTLASKTKVDIKVAFTESAGGRIAGSSVDENIFFACVHESSYNAADVTLLKINTLLDIVSYNFNIRRLCVNVRESGTNKALFLLLDENQQVYLVDVDFSNDQAIYTASMKAFVNEYKSFTMDPANSLGTITASDQFICGFTDEIQNQKFSSNVWFVSSVQDFLRYNDMLDQSVTLNKGDGNFKAGVPTITFTVSSQILSPTGMTVRTPPAPSSTGKYETTNIESTLSKYYKDESANAVSEIFDKNAWIQTLCPGSRLYDFSLLVCIRDQDDNYADCSSSDKTDYSTYFSEKQQTCYPQVFTTWISNVNWDDHSFELEPTRLWYDDTRFSSVIFGFQDLLSKRTSGLVTIFMHVGQTDLDENGPEITAIAVSPHMLQKSVDRGKDLEIKLFEEISPDEFDAAEYAKHSYTDCYKLDSSVNVFDVSFNVDTASYEDCEPFVVWSLDSQTISVSGAATHSASNSAAVYLNLVVLEADYTSTGKFQMHLAIVIVTVNSVEVSNPGITINMPWSDFYIANKDTFSYKMTVPLTETAASLGESTNSTSIESEQIDETAAETYNVPSKWTQQMLDEALKEDEQRSKKQASVVSTKITTTKTGQVVITFSDQILIPSYILAEFNSSQTSIASSSFEKTTQQSEKAPGRLLSSYTMAPSVSLDRITGILSKDLIPDVLENFDETAQQYIGAVVASVTSKIKSSLSDILQKISQTYVKDVAQSIVKSSVSSKSDDCKRFLEEMNWDARNLQKDPGSSIGPSATGSSTGPSQPGSGSTQGGPTGSNDALNGGKDGYPSNDSGKPSTGKNGASQSNPCKPVPIEAKITKSNKTLFFGNLDSLLKIQSADKLLSITYQVVSLSRTDITLQLLFSDSSLVTDETEIEIELDFAEIDPSFKVSTTKFSVLLKSLGSESTTISSASDTAAAVTAAVAGMNAVLQLVMSGCLAQVWGMINGMQLLVHFPIFKVVFPEIPEAVVGSLVSVATFDIPYFNIEFVNQAMFEEGGNVFEYDKSMDETTAETLSNRLSVSTYENRYFCVNMGSVYVLLLLALIGLCSIFILRPFKARLHRVALKYSEKVSNMLLWNFFIRLILEGVLEISFALLIALVNLDAIYQINSFWQVLDLLVAAFCIIFLGVLVVWLLIIMYQYRGSFEKMAEPVFHKNYGSVIEGMKPGSMPLLFPLLFLLRRFSFAMSGMFLYDQPIFQIVLQTYLALITGGYLAHFKPFEEPLVNRLELFNEVSNLFMLCMLFCFTDLLQAGVGSGEKVLEIIFVVAIAGNLSVHLFFLGRDSFVKVRQSCKARAFKRQQLQKFKLLSSEEVESARLAKQKTEKAEEDERNLFQMGGNLYFNFDEANSSNFSERRIYKKASSIESLFDFEDFLNVFENPQQVEQFPGKTKEPVEKNQLLFIEAVTKASNKRKALQPVVEVADFDDSYTK